MNRKIIQIAPASEEMAKIVIDASPTGGDGRSEWMWVWVQVGDDPDTAAYDLMLACYPQGDTYSATETEHSA